MIIVWKGAGILAGIIPIVTVLIFQTYIGDAPEFTGLSLLASAVPIWFLGKKWNSAPAKEFLDPKTGNLYQMKSKHSLFWISMEYWAFIVGGYGLYLYASEVLGWAGTMV